jgi:hypothetical protein
MAGFQVSTEEIAARVLSRPRSILPGGARCAQPGCSVPIFGVISTRVDGGRNRMTLSISLIGMRWETIRFSRGPDRYSL